MATHLILGTAGHIDHGKTALVTALTGVNTDRLPEEQRRGITIDLGFAALDLGPINLGIVDVPGHERFVRNMLAGATGVDLALLVVAADDSVKPQTREHLEILQWLGLEQGVIALTKCDLAAPDWLDLVEEEVRELVSETFLSSAAIVRTSATTGQGIEPLRAALSQAGQAAADSPRTRRRDTQPARLAIDRVFTISGHGTVVTGSLVNGQIAVGDAMMLEPGGRETRVRGLQSHDQACQHVVRGQRAAVNLAGVRHDEIHRGQELAAPGLLQSSRLMTVRLQLGPRATRPLKNRARLRCHLGTAELMASVVLLDTDALAPGQAAYAQLHLSAPAVASWNQPFVVRLESPVVTIGGGQVLDPNAVKLRARQTEPVSRLPGLHDSDPLRRSAAALYFNGLRPWREEDLVRLAGIDDPRRVMGQLKDEGLLVELTVSPTRSLLVHRDVLDEVFARIESALTQAHDAMPLAVAFPRSRIMRRLEYLGDAALRRALLEALGRTGRIQLTEAGMSLEGRGPKLSKNEQQLLEALLERFQEAGFQPPTAEEITAAATTNRDVVPLLLQLAAAQERLVEIASGVYLSAEHEVQLRQMLVPRLRDEGGLTVSQIRDLLGTTRKFAVPICGYLDRIGFTRREGDLRVLADPAAS